ncbi:WSC domain-containing protein, partial [Zopfochytrium polystomum]
MSVAVLSGGWSYSNCYVDALSATNARSLPYPAGVDLTNQACADACGALGFPVAGTEYYGECYCGTSLPKTKAANATAECSFPCKADSAQLCGGSQRLTVYTKGSTFTPSVPSISSFGCYVDALQPTHSLPVSVGSNLNNGQCVAACSALGFPLAGTEYYGECYCGSVLPDKADSESECSTPCNNGAGYCGGNGRLTLYQSQTVSLWTPSPPKIDSWAYRGCYADAVNPRSFPKREGVSNTTNEVCAAACAKDGYLYFGTEHFGECFCSNSIAGLAKLPDSSCTMPCNGNIKEVCGDNAALTVYSTTSTTVAPFTPTAPAIDCWSSVGCYVDTVNPRSFPYRASKGNSNQACTASCAAAGYAYAGTENFGECFCTNDLASVTKTSDSSCILPCKDDIHQICGDVARLTVYQYTCGASTSSSST